MKKSTYDDENDDDNDVMLDKDDLDGNLDDYHQLSIYRQRLIKAQIQDIEVNYNDYIDDNDRDGDNDADDKDITNRFCLDNHDHLSNAGILNENNDLNNYNVDNNLLLYKIEQVHCRCNANVLCC